MIVVPDAGPLIYLGGAGHLEILRLLYSEVVVPRVVFDLGRRCWRTMQGLARSRRSAAWSSSERLVFCLEPSGEASFRRLGQSW